MEPVRFGSDFKNQPRIGQRYIQSTAGAVSLKSTKGLLQCFIVISYNNLFNSLFPFALMYKTHKL